VFKKWRRKDEQRSAYLTSPCSLIDIKLKHETNRRFVVQKVKTCNNDLNQHRFLKTVRFFPDKKKITKVSYTYCFVKFVVFDTKAHTYIYFVVL